MIHLTPPWKMPLTNLWNSFSFQIMKNYSLRGFHHTADFFKWRWKWKKNNSENKILVSSAIIFCWMCFRGTETETREQSKDRCVCSVISQCSNKSAPLDADFNPVKHVSLEQETIPSKFIYDKALLTAVQFVCGIAVVLIQLNNKWICCFSLQLQSVSENKREQYFNQPGVQLGEQWEGSFPRGEKCPQDNKAQFINLNHPCLDFSHQPYFAQWLIHTTPMSLLRAFL